ncbi:MAG: hypothetical protein JRM98_04275 [Nitrososphaerota archaeon]|nr:hypothetical protein [Nitrososphaerota archaeon]MDG7043316.1 hypothetical protein [Nitrososphaerota archaeon]
MNLWRDKPHRINGGKASTPESVSLNGSSRYEGAVKLSICAMDCLQQCNIGAIKVGVAADKEMPACGMARRRDDMATINSPVQGTIYPALKDGLEQRFIFFKIKYIYD